MILIYLIAPLLLFTYSLFPVYLCTTTTPVNLIGFNKIAIYNNKQWSISLLSQYYNYQWRESLFNYSLVDKSFLWFLPCPNTKLPPFYLSLLPNDTASETSYSILRWTDCKSVLCILPFFFGKRGFSAFKT